jgi:hypothetical protein
MDAALLGRAASALGFALLAGIAGALTVPRNEACQGSSPVPPTGVTGVTASAAARAHVPPLPRLLSETGLFAGGGRKPQVLPFVPQYPLWSDGATKRRWVSIPAGESIDGSDPDNWVLPAGTRLWKELSFGEREPERVETRYLEKLPDGTFRFATYLWESALGDAVLAPEAGVSDVHALSEGKSHDLPGRADCRVCHEGRTTSVLGFNALQLSPDRDPLAPHAEPVPEGAVNLTSLVERGLLRGFPRELLQKPPRIVASSALARAAQGYLFANCSGCHNASGPLAELGLDFDQSVAAPSHEPTYVGAPSRFRLPGERASLRVARGRPEQSAVWFRMQSRALIAQMPPLGTKLVDRDGLRLISGWITSLATHR